MAFGRLVGRQEEIQSSLGFFRMCEATGGVGKMRLTEMVALTCLLNISIARLLDAALAQAASTSSLQQLDWSGGTRL